MGLLDEYNTQEAVTIGYGIEMKKEQREKDIAILEKALADSGISNEIKEKIMASFRSMSAN